MRPLRLLLSLLACVLAFTLLLYHGLAQASSSSDFQESRMGAYFSWRAPSSLFPPSAVISLTDDNSTFFLARPAAFGPLLPIKSLSGQLWIGSGFGDDNLGHSGPGSNVEGELGCSDVPGWGIAESRADPARLGTLWKDRMSSADGLAMRAADGVDVSFTASKDSINSDDGTDDHILATSVGSGARKSKGNRKDTTSSHADIQSLQESAEIAGKIVLLSRGGCGFLDKVKWAQRRGAVAVIIGDDIRGGPLVTMYARGDTSNMTISALFTSHTTAHLLSSLMPIGNKTTTSFQEDANRLGIALGDGVDGAKQKTRTQTKASKAKPALDMEPQPDVITDTVRQDTKRDIERGSGWFRSMFGADDATGRPASIQRPPNTGNVDWIMQTEFDEQEDTAAKRVKATKKRPSSGPSDGFEIGVHDWRDPDMVAQDHLMKQSTNDRASRSKAARVYGDRKDNSSPGSSSTTSKFKKDTTKAPSRRKTKGWLDRLTSGTWDEPKATRPALGANIIDAAQPVSNPVHLHDIHVPGAVYNEQTEHEGLWITLTPTSMSSSPFFDTLLVLVVSPLVTLTVVYALLLLRSRIRRRRWRAPKSVVERLPVRTYQTMSSTPTSSTTSSISTPATANTPLLASSSPRTIRPRPRSRTDSQIPAQASSSAQSLEEAEEEKREAGLSEWRRKYGGKQKECVVCLEEYIDGVSRVMSLPCGHEFHQDCITPWLTTRRRTCPICKGDVVRSLARSQSMISPVPDEFREVEEEDEVQEQAALLTNDDPASQRPISRDDEALEDLERGVAGHVDRNR